MTTLYLCASPKIKEEYADLINSIKQRGHILKEFDITAWQDSSHITLLLGGDGSLNYFINSCRKKGILVMPTVLYLACGTGNDFSRLFKNREPNIENFEFLLKGTVKEIPIAQCNDIYFINVATGGELAKITQTKNEGAKKYLGRLSYYLEGVKAGKELELREYSVTTAHLQKPMKAFGFIVAQGAYAGGGVKVSESARLHPFLFECAFFEQLGLKEVFLSFLEMQKEYSNLKEEHGELMKEPWLSIASKEPIPVKLDGEPYQSKELHFKHSEAVLPFLV